MDMNKVFLSGLAMSTPSLIYLNDGKTPFCKFTLRVNEPYVDKQNNRQITENFIEIESLGKNAVSVCDKVRSGNRYIIDGYLRRSLTEGSTNLAIRTFYISKDITEKNEHYVTALLEAINVVKKSKTLQEVITTLEVLLRKE